MTPSSSEGVGLAEDYKEFVEHTNTNFEHVNMQVAQIQSDSHSMNETILQIMAALQRHDEHLSKIDNETKRLDNNVKLNYATHMTSYQNLREEQDKQIAEKS